MISWKIRTLFISCKLRPCHTSVTTLNLTDVANKVATETNEVLDTDVLKIMDVRTDYEHMLFDVAKKVCALYGVEQTPEVLSACNLQHILGQINVLASSVDSHYNHVVSFTQWNPVSCNLIANLQLLYLFKF